MKKKWRWWKPIAENRSCPPLFQFDEETIGNALASGCHIQICCHVLLEKSYAPSPCSNAYLSNFVSDLCVWRVLTSRCSFKPRFFKGEYYSWEKWISSTQKSRFSCKLQACLVSGEISPVMWCSNCLGLDCGKFLKLSRYLVNIILIYFRLPIYLTFSLFLKK